MAFKIGNKTVLHDADPSATLLTNSNLDKLQINSIDVLTHDGTTVTLQNVDIPAQTSTNAGLTTSINTNTANIAINSTAINNNTTAISNNATAINNNTTSISNNATAINNNTTAISNNATAITNNATAITNNETAINNNVTAIANTLVDAKSYTDTRETAITAVINALTTDDVPESGSPTNVYFTNARVDTALGSVNADIIPASSETHNLGSATARWNKLFLKGSSIDLGGVDISASGTGMSVGGSDMASKTYTDQAEADANTYTDTAIANLVDTAPTTLDTLNELASALGDDANFSTTVTTSIATKLATADFTSTADTWLGTKDTDDLAEGSNLYYTDTRVDSRITANASGTITNSDLDMNGNRVLFANVYPTTGDLPSATTYHGMFAHVHDQGAGYFAHAGGWTKLANASEVFDGNYNSLSNLPTIPTNNNQLSNGAGYITSFTDTNTTYTAGNGLTLSGTEFLMSGGYTGNFTATGDVTAYSDKRLKRNIETITNAVDTVSKLRGVNFEKDGRYSTGVIAQEVEEVLPQVVHTDPDGMKSVAYGNIVGILIEAIKEQQKEIEELKKRL
jgi:hypothetical protein